ncbi:Tyrosine-protein kinase wzc [Marinomonas spartinae]|uniref:polysaccharide biosynthesis tyrosine autokinase n=1 Tax=Marinomonas spartinae TaxID=1792290 RepID=UPI000808AD18|nr:polysaccharide biosynthesis tyrosine autokinase [Marinomonas spartinae]SBS35923.1 Tyrosine-protein kinase wzc [Marinomonas spartinae]
MSLQSISGTTNKESDEIDLTKLLGSLLDARWFILLITCLFVSGGVAFALLSTPIYKADALIQVEKKDSGVSSLLGDLGGLAGSLDSGDKAEAEIAIIKSRTILKKTVEKLHLNIVMHPIYFPIVGKGIARLSHQQIEGEVSRFEVPSDKVGEAFELSVLDPAGRTYALSFDGKVILSGAVGQLVKQGPYTIRVDALDAHKGDRFTLTKITDFSAIESLARVLSVSERGQKTGILTLSITGENKAQLTDILNDISQNYFLQNVDRNSEEAEQSLVFLRKHLPTVRKKLDNAENKLNDYREKNDSIDLSLEAKGTLHSMVELESKLNDLTFKENEMSKLYTKDYPAYKSLLQNRETLLKEKAKLNDKIQKMPQTQRVILNMKRDVEINQEIYIRLLNKIQELSVVKAGTVGNVRILDTAQAYPNPIKPKKSLIVVVSMMLGLMLSVGTVLVRMALHKGIQSAEEIETLGLPVYASVPKSEAQEKLSDKLLFKQQRKRLTTKGLHVKDILLAEANPTDLSVEALRGLRTSLHFAMLEAKNNIVMITGPAPSIGKSFISSNFAAVAAKTGQKVLLVDADMRKGYLHKQFGLTSENGLSDFLSGKKQEHDVIRDTEIENLHLVVKGQVPPNPSELLMHQRFRTFCEWASANYDLVLIDTPPILAVTDASIIGAFAGTTLMVGRFNQNTLKEIEVSYRRFEQVGVDVKGFILNAVEKKAGNSYGYYNYEYKSDKN